jgi:hypothetical protein
MTEREIERFAQDLAEKGEAEAGGLHVRLERWSRRDHSCNPTPHARLRRTASPFGLLGPYAVPSGQLRDYSGEASREGLGCVVISIYRDQ